MTDTELRLTAIREAGHAAMAMHQGIAVRRATIRPSDVALGMVEHYPIGEWFRPDIEIDGRTRNRIEKTILVLWAGTLAEEIIGGCEHPEGEEDIENIVRLSSHIVSETEEQEAYIEWLRLRCRNWVRLPFVARSITALADALLERQSLTGSQLRDVSRAAFVSTLSRTASIPSSPAS
jgi:hypothetical protein